jgi:hypothetical protein
MYCHKLLVAGIGLRGDEIAGDDGLECLLLGDLQRDPYAL